MKKFLPLILLLAGCTNQALENQMAALNDKVQILESVQATSFSRIDNLEQEQTFQYKDIDSTKRALASVYVLTLEARGIALKVDSTVRVGRDRAGRRTETVMTALTYIPFLSQFIKKQ